MFTYKQHCTLINYQLIHWHTNRFYILLYIIFSQKLSITLNNQQLERNTVCKILYIELLNNQELNYTTFQTLADDCMLMS